MLFADALPAPRRVFVVGDDDDASSLRPGDSPGTWSDKRDILVWTEAAGDGTTIMLDAPGAAVRRVHLRWDTPAPEGCRFLGDHWERGYGDLEWRGMVPERQMPWYFLAFDGRVTQGFGVETGGAAFACWQVDNSGVSLWLDVACGSRGVRLNGRPLTCAVIRSRQGTPEETPWEAARALCARLCPGPRLADHPVYGSNNWYYAYGRSSHDDILRDTDILVPHAPQDNPNRPYMVIDDGWQANRRASDWVTTQQGPWDRGHDDFPDMPGLARAMRERGARPGIWIRPLGAAPGTPESRLLSNARLKTGIAPVPTLDPSLLENREQIAADFRRLCEWGYGLIKHDWTTFDLLGGWGFDMIAGGLTRGDWQFADRSRTTAEIVRDLYKTIRDASGNAVLIGCNTIGHLGAGLFEVQRTGDDTSGREWERTRKMGVNTLAFRMCQHDTFFAADADCVGLTNAVPWHLNRQWLDLLARSGTPLFVSAAPDAIGPEQANALREAFAIAATPQPPGVALDWMHTTCPTRWQFGDETLRYDWFAPGGIL